MKNKIVINLKGGDSLSIDKSDYDSFIEQVRADVLVRMVVDAPDRVFITKNYDSERIQMLYKILTEQKDMAPQLKTSYLTMILELSKDTSAIVENLKEKIKS